MNSLVTAVITTYKRDAATVERAVRSIVNQSYHPIEIIVVDDSPAEYKDRHNVEMVVNKYGAIYIPHVHNMGACAARNTGLQAAHGEYIAYLDDDDEWTESKILKQVEKICKSDVALVYCKNSIIDDEIGQVKYRKTELHKGYVLKDLLLTNFIGGTSFPLMKTSALHEIGGFDVEMQSAQDYDTWIRIAEKYPIDYVDEALVIYHTHQGEQISKTGKKRIAGIERLIKKYKKYIDEDEKVKWGYNMALARAYGEAGEKTKGFSLWINAARQQPYLFVENLKYLKKIMK